MLKIIKLNLFSIGAFVLFLSSIPSDKKIFGTPNIKAGQVKITGRITGPDTNKKDSIYVSIFVSNPILGEDVHYKLLADQSGKFSADVDVETDISLITIDISLKPHTPLFVKLKTGSITNIDIAYKADLSFEHVDMTPLEMTVNDMTKSIDVISEMLDHSSGRKPEPLYNKTTDYFLKHVRTVLSERLEILNDNELLSKELKQIHAKNFSLSLYNTFVFDYERYMISNYYTSDGDKNLKPGINKIDKSYYRFLKDFNLNDPQYLICSEFSKLQKTILGNQIIGLPQIGDSDISSWLAKVKIILSDLVGFDDGPYYDILAANAYGRQLSEELKPLTTTQKKNIATYWKNGETAKILLRKNRQVIELGKSKSPPVINDISSVSNEKVMETILAKHKNKVVFIDLWATWCAPCLDAMQQFRSTKSKFHGKDVVFVYLTNETSPQKLWEEQIKGIGNEHYHLTEGQWDFIMNQFDLKYIPSYLLFNRKGEIMREYTGFPGNEEVEKLINSLL